MKTPKLQPMMRAAAALAIALAGTLPAVAVAAVPAAAEAGTPAPAGPSTSHSPAPTTAAAPAPADSAPSSPAGSSSPAPSSPASSSASVAPLLSDAGLAEAVQKDLGMTLAEFNAAGALARRAADAVPSLRALPGYVGISLKGGKVVVEGSGAGLKARIDELNQLDDKNQATQADFVLAAPAAAATAASAPSSPERVAGSIEQLFQAYVREVGMVGLQAVAYTDGHFVIRTGGTNTPESVLPTVLDPQVPGTPSGTPSAVPGKVSPAEFVARYANVQLEKGAAIKTEQDFFGGQGYIIDGRTVCSAGFGAFSPAGGPLVLTAGHCAADGSAKQAMIEDPAGAPAAGGAGSGAAAGILGTFGFSQFGGPGNSKVAADGSNVGTDIAVLRGIRSGLRLQPAATRWDNPADPGPTSVKIVGTVAPFQGQAVCRSGRTTGWKCGTVDSVGIWVLPGSKNDLRAIRAFDSSSVKSLGGDSGGPWVSGNFAVGMHTGAEKLGDMQLRAIATTLEDAMTQIPGGVQLQLFLNKPELVTPANSGTVAAGELITGRVPAAPASEVAPKSKVLITVGTHELEVPVDAAGKWSFRAPLPAGQLAFSAETVNGYSHSGPVSFTATVVQAPAPLPAPGMTTPTGVPLPALKSIAGTGMPGATVVLSGDVAGSGTVGLDGRWAVPLTGPAVFGKVTATATLTSPDIADSPAVTGTFTVIPPAPAGSSIQDGLHLRKDSLPEAISGTVVDGAEVAVLIDGVQIPAAQTGGGSGVGAEAAIPSLDPHVLVADGHWSVPFPDGLAVGPHTLTVSQSVDGIASRPVALAFTIDAAHTSTGTPDHAAVAGRPGSPAQPGSLGQPGVPGRPGIPARAGIPAQPGGLAHPGNPAQPGTPAQSGSPGQPSSPAQMPTAQAPAAQAPVPPSDTTVTVDGSTPGGTSSGRADPLASMGASGLLPAAGLGAGALLLGAAFVVFARRRSVR